MKCLSDSSGLRLDITGIFANDKCMQSERRVTRTSNYRYRYIVYACKVEYLEQIGDSFFERTGDVVAVPDSVRELCDSCFKRCSSLRRVTFGPSSSLDRVGALCFHGCALVEFEIPVSVQAIGGGAFGECALAGGIVCRDGCCFRAIDSLVLSDDSTKCFSIYGVMSSLCILDSVRELCDGCFEGCPILRRVTFRPSSLVEWIGIHEIRGTSVKEATVPDGVSCDGCFRWCLSLHHIVFTSLFSLERIGFHAFPHMRDK